MPPPRSRSIAPLGEAPPRSRWIALLGDVHFWIPLGVFVAGVVLLTWLP